MKKTYIHPMMLFVCADSTTLMAASGGASSEVDNGNGPSGSTDKDDGTDESDAKGHSNYDVWEE